MSKENVLFLCTGNSARSLMAEALLRASAGDVFDVYSAGTAPRGVNPLTLRVLNEVGVSTEGLRSKNVREYHGKMPMRYLIVVCWRADRLCPTVWAGVTERLVWRIDDPARMEDTDDDPLENFRECRDLIDERIQSWLAELRQRRTIPARVA